MFLEFCNYNNSFVSSSDKQIQEIFEAIELKFEGVAIPLYLLRKTQPFIKDLSLSIATSSDFPEGKGDKKLRLHETIVGLRAGANKIDLVASPFLIEDGEYLELCEEFKTHKRACDEYDAELRIVINHTSYSPSKIITIARVVEDSGVEFMLPSSGFHNDDIYDNLLVSNSIESNTGLQVISNGYIWLEKQYEAAIGSGIFGLRLYNFQLLQK
jgi:deoxyribose-phosphate aldolase|tara:strand:- start:4208 stop:4846 length:639 start_codon:yes stop_codon:yes gene_type:complete